MGEFHEQAEKIRFLEHVSVFDDVADDDKDKIAEALQVKAASTGETIFKKDEPGDTLYIIAQGKVRVHDGNHVLGRLQRGEVFGEFSLFDNEKRSASITAEEPTQLYTLDQKDFYELMATNSSVIHGVMRVLIKRLRYMNELENKLSKSYLKISKQKDEIEKRNQNIQQQKKELEHKNKQLEQSNREKNHLIQVIAHDLRNPLASSICVADMLNNPDKSDCKEHADTVSVLENSLKNMNNIINQILHVHELNTKNLSLKLEPINVALVIKQILENFDYAISKKELNVEFKQKNTFIVADENLITLVFENLLYNVIRFSPDFGHVFIDFEDSENTADVIIRDDGNLDKARQHRKLFGLYQQPQPEALEKKPGAKDSIIIKYTQSMNAKLTLEKVTKGFGVKLTFNKPDKPQKEQKQ